MIAALSSATATTQDGEAYADNEYTAGASMSDGNVANSGTISALSSATAASVTGSADAYSDYTAGLGVDDYGTLDNSGRTS